MNRKFKRAAPLWLAALAVVLALSALVVWLNYRDEATLDAAQPPSAMADAARIERGAYLARAGNCSGCHTARGAADYAGGRAIDTPFGQIYASNLTPHERTGIGNWSAAEFWRAMHNGRSKDGRLLYPAFPYLNYTEVTREDSDAIYAFLRSIPPVDRANTAHALRWPYSLQASLAVWRALYFRPNVYEPKADRPADWNRGAYLVRGLGHCAACHTARNALGATRSSVELGGGSIPMQDWYAPSLVSAREAGVSDWPIDEVASLLKTGVSARASVMGPMAEVVYRSTQYLTDQDLRAMAVFLKTQPPAEVVIASAPKADPKVIAQGERIFADQCASCHGERGQGAAGIYPPLAGNRAVTLPASNNAVKAILNGGFAPTTAGNPRPFGMPPFRQTLSDSEIAAVATYIRQSWGHAASAVTSPEVGRAR